MQVTGTLLRGRTFEPIEGRVVIEDGTIAAVEEAPVDSDRIVLPAFVNAHTRLGPNGGSEAGREEAVAALDRSLQLMERSGTAAFVEFRDGGVAGVETLRAALTGRDVESVILGSETSEAMAAADGFGADGTGTVERERNATRRAGKLFGIRAGERDPDDINAALDLDPDFLVGMVHPDPIHYDRVADAAVPIAVCPRSNLATGVGVPPIREWVDRTTVALGTGDAVRASPSMFREMELAWRVSDLTAAEVLAMATVNGATIAGLDCGLIEEGRDGKLVVLDGDSDALAGDRDAVRAVVCRAGPADVERVIH